MISRNALLIKLLHLVDRVPLPSEYQRRRRGRPYVYPTRLIIKLRLVIVFRRLRSGYTLHCFLQQSLPEMEELREAISRETLSLSDGPSSVVLPFCPRPWRRRSLCWASC